VAAELEVGDLDPLDVAAWHSRSVLIADAAALRERALTYPGAA
jgi:hypothetical protein